MSDLLFKLNNPLIISASTGVSTEAGGVPFEAKEFDGNDNQTIKLSLPQDVSTTSDVNFNQVTLSPETLTIGTGSTNIVLKDGIISGSSIDFENDIIVSSNYVPEDGLTFKGALNAPNTTFAATQTTQSNNTGSTKFGTEVDSHRQRFTGSLDVTGSLDLNSNVGYTEISNDTTTSGSSDKALVTEKVVFAKLQSLKPDRDYLRKSFVHTGSFINSTTSSFNAITASAPTNLTSTTENDFMFFINGMVMENDALQITQKSETNLELHIDSSELGYTIELSDEVIGFGKFNS